MDTLRQLQSDNEVTLAELTPEVREQIARELSSCSNEETQAALRILDDIILKANDDAKEELNRLKSSIETCEPQEFSLDSLSNQIEDERAQKMLEAYEFSIANDLESLYGDAYKNLDEPAKESIKLVFWDILQSQLWVRGLVNVGVWKITSLTEWITQLFGQTDEQWQGSILTAYLESRSSMLEEMWAGSNFISDEMIEDIRKAAGIIESLIWKQADNLKTLFTLTSSKNLTKEQENQIFANPEVLREILDTGKINRDGIQVDLTEWTCSVNSSIDLEQIQTAFMTELATDSNKVGSFMDRIASQVDRFDSFFKGLWMDEWLDGFKKMMSEIPVVWFLFKLIFWNALGWDFNAESFQRAIDSISDLSKVPALTNLNNFMADFLKDNDNANSPLWRIFWDDFDEDFLSNNDAFFDSMKENDISPSNRGFWKKILTGEWAEGKEAFIYNNHVKPVLERSTPTKENLISALNSIRDIPEPADAPADGTEDTSTPPETTTIAEFAEATAFPFQFEGVEINYDTTNFELQAWEHRFKISSIWGSEVRPDMLSMVSPNIILQENNVVVEYTIPWSDTKNLTLNREVFPDFLRQAISWDTATLSIPNEENPIEIVFTKIV